MFLLAVLLVVFLSFFTGRRDLDLPTGCDEFGYLQLARGIAMGKPFDTPTSRPFDPRLIAALTRSDLPFGWYRHVIAPHAYHLDPHALKVINQYPPGTSLLLSPLSPDRARALAPTVFAVFIFLSLVLSLVLDERRASFFGVNLAFLVTAALPSVAPFRDSFTTVNSLAPTFGLLVAAGYFLPRRLSLSLVLLGLTTAFRIANAVLFLPLLVAFVLLDPAASFRTASVLRRALRATLLFVGGGLWIYGAYAWVLLGSPFRPTYVPADLATTVAGFVPNAAFYFDLHEPWFTVHVLLLAAVGLMAALRRIPGRWALVAAAVAFVNYLFFVFHEVRISYYPYASAMILLGFVLHHVAREIRGSRLAWTVPVAGAFVLLLQARGVVRARPGEDLRQAFLARVEPYVRCFSGHDVVWADFRSGTLEYATGKVGFRYHWGSPQARRFVLKWLRARGYRQAIWLSDLEVSRESVVDELRGFRVGYVARDCGELGTILDVPPRTGG